MNVEKYLDRIKLKGSLTPNSSLLTKIHHHHVANIPFENINNYLGIPVSLDLDSLYEKIILSKRGGYCYELNGLLHHLLLSLGFNARLLAANLYDGENVLLESFHAVIQVELENQNWLLDVGYGSDGQLTPLMMSEKEQQQRDNLYQFSKSTNEKILFSRFNPKNGWHKLMQISLEEVDLSFFNLRNLYHQESTESMFKRNFMCSMYSSKSSYSIKNTLYSSTQENKTFSQALSNEEELLNILEKDFTIKISKNMAHELIVKCKTATTSFNIL